MSTTSEFYREDLTHAHDEGFGEFAQNAAAVLLGELQRSALSRGTVVDLGCGGGILARHLTDAGYTVVGIDVSESMIEVARRRVPEADFRVRSYLSVDLPGCVAVTAIGEALNYKADARNTEAARARLFGKIYDALAPGGFLLFDMAGPGRSDGEAKGFREGPGWTVLWEKTADREHRELTRRITIFRQIGEHYRRSTETHRLELVEPAQIVQALEAAGFSAGTLTHYGPMALPVGLTGFLARKRAAD